MRKLHGSFVLFGALSVLACSVADDSTESPETAGEAAQELTGGCNYGTLGHPCDPDGASGPLLECQGVCRVGSNGFMGCGALSSTDVASLNGRICGSSGGTSCANTCQNGACIVGQAKVGTACRPPSGPGGFSDSCDGACDAAGLCVALANPCPYGPSGCVFNACDMTAAATCTKVNLPKGIQCTDSSQCTSGDTCDGAGTCTGTAKNCSDNNVCTTDTCNPSNGACLSTYNTLPCSDGNACTTGDVCASGSCQPGAAVNCNDSNACTTDACAPATGCTHVAKNCDDSNACTTDSCNANTGACVNTPITGCGTGGTGGGGGTGGATGGTGGATGGTGGATGGTGGATGGTGGATGGTGGTGGATGGTGGATGGTGGATGGTGGATGGTGGATGGTGGGTAGSGGGTAGSGGGTAGAGGAAGSAGSAGSATGGSSSGGKDGGVGGSKDGGADGGSNLDVGDDDGGCGCRVPSQKAPSSSWLVLAGLGALLLRRRR